MSWWFRLLVYLPLLYLIAIVVVGQHHRTARDTLRAAWPRSLRWALWSAALLGSMLLLELLFIGF